MKMPLLRSSINGGHTCRKQWRSDSSTKPCRTVDKDDSLCMLCAGSDACSAVGDGGAMSTSMEEGPGRHRAAADRAASPTVMLSPPSAAAASCKSEGLTLSGIPRSDAAAASTCTPEGCTWADGTCRLTAAVKSSGCRQSGGLDTVQSSCIGKASSSRRLRMLPMMKVAQVSKSLCMVSTTGAATGAFASDCTCGTPSPCSSAT